MKKHLIYRNDLGELIIKTYSTLSIVAKKCIFDQTHKIGNEFALINYDGIERIEICIIDEHPSKNESLIVENIDILIVEK